MPKEALRRSRFFQRNDPEIYFFKKCNADSYTLFFLQYMYDFLEAVITRQTSPEEAYRKLDEMATKQTETLRKLTKQV